MQQRIKIPFNSINWIQENGTINPNYVNDEAHFVGDGSKQAGIYSAIEFDPDSYEMELKVESTVSTNMRVITCNELQPGSPNSSDPSSEEYLNPSVVIAPNMEHTFKITGKTINSESQRLQFDIATLPNLGVLKLKELVLIKL